MEVKLPVEGTGEVHVGGRALAKGPQIRGTVYLGSELLGEGLVQMNTVKVTNPAFIPEKPETIRVVPVNEQGRFYLM